jgi:hypothetical protein
MSKFSALLAAGVAAALAVGIGGGGARAAAVPSAAGPAVFSGLSCEGGSFCLATGTYHKAGGPYTDLLEAWDGRTWRTFPKPRYYDNDTITCGGPSFCLAATAPPKDGTRTVAWNGRTWQAFKPQPPDPQDVTCPAAKFCVTQSSSGPFPTIGGTSAVSWTGGTSWQTMPGAQSQCEGPWCVISSLSCASASICFDQGSYCTDDDCDSQDYFAGTWNGTTWSPSDDLGPGLACAGRSFCMNLTLTATGASATISRDWGNSWHDASAGLAAACHRAGCAQLHALACGTPWSCVAFTSSARSAAPAYALIWNGATWKTARLARADGGLPTLALLACGSQHNCAAIGTYRPAGTSGSQPIAEHWNGSAWKVTPIPTTP